MKAPQEYKKWISRMRKRYGKKNGTIPNGILDHPYFERLIYNSKKRNKRRK